MEVGKCIRELREKNNISQEVLSEQLGVSRQTISSWETGKSYPDIVSVIKMSDIFDVSLDELLKKDKKLIQNMQSQMDIVNSNKYIIFTLIFASLIFGGFYLIRTFVEIPKINDLFSNVIVLITFIVGVMTYLLTNISVSKFLNKKTSNKTIVKTIIVMLVIMALFFIFSLFERLTIVAWQIFILRIITIFVFIFVCLFIFKILNKDEK